VSLVDIGRQQTCRMKALATNVRETTVLSVGGYKNTINIAVDEWDLTAKTKQSMTAHTVNGTSQWRNQDKLELYRYGACS